MRSLQVKVLQSTGREGEVIVTIDGATNLKSFHIDNAAVKVFMGLLIICIVVVKAAYKLIKLWNDTVFWGVIMKCNLKIIAFFINTYLLNIYFILSKLKPLSYYSSWSIKFENYKFMCLI